LRLELDEAADLVDDMAVAIVDARRRDAAGVRRGASRLEPLTQTRRETAYRLAMAAEFRDPQMIGHLERVGVYSELLARRWGMTRQRGEQIRVASALHDVGKIGIPDRILQKPEALTDEEFEVMKRHAQLGHEIVMAAERPIEAGWILHHHERIDGNGYPAGLAGEQIPLESRIILVADAFEAITADRPYRQHSSIEQALAELRRHSGSQFDPTCVDALRRVIAGEATKAA
jgi:putative two-component system response regulator